MTAVVLRGDAARLPLPDASVDLIVTSPPYWSLRSYTDGGEHYDGQIGDEATPQLYLDALVDCTREWARVLKPAGSMFVVLGDKYANDAKWGGGTSGKHVANLHGPTGIGRAKVRTGIPAKSLIGLPWRYALRCVDELRLGLRQEIIWAKTNGMPESVTDRTRRAHEQVFHFTRSPSYFAAVDEIREPHQPVSIARGQRNRFAADRTQLGVGSPNTLDPKQHCHPLGALPGTVWNVATQPLTIPAELGIEHHAAYPVELVRRIILGWSPAAICCACGQGRRPVSEYTGQEGRHPGGGGTYRAIRPAGARDTNLADAALRARAITGYACDCTPRTSRRGQQGDWREGRELMPDRLADDWHSPGASVPRRPGGFGTRVPLSPGEWEYHLDGWTPPPVRPALVVDPFGGTGTTALVADVLGRHAITIDRSADYCRAATWRTRDPGQRAQALQVPKPPAVIDGQGELDLFGEATA